MSVYDFQVVNSSTCSLSKLQRINVGGRELCIFTARLVPSSFHYIQKLACCCCLLINEEQKGIHPPFLLLVLPLYKWLSFPDAKKRRRDNGWAEELFQWDYNKAPYARRGCFVSWLTDHHIVVAQVGVRFSLKGCMRFVPPFQPRARVLRNL